MIQAILLIWLLGSFFWLGMFYNTPTVGPNWLPIVLSFTWPIAVPLAYIAYKFVFKGDLSKAEEVVNSAGER